MKISSKLLFSFFALAVGVSSVYAWTGPTGNPPVTNASIPINVSATSQVKTGGLNVGSLGVDGGAIVNGALTIPSNQVIGGFGAMTTAGVLDWNDVSNTRAGNGYTLLMGNAANGPGPAYYFHTLNFEYSSKNGAGNMTQLAIPYGSPGGGGNIYMRGRYSGTWSSWSQVGASASSVPWSGVTGKPTAITQINNHTGTYTSLDISGSNGGYAGINFSDYGYRLMVRSDGLSGIYSESTGWKWYFDNNGSLITGSVPIARIPDISSASVNYATSAGSAGSLSNFIIGGRSAADLNTYTTSGMYGLSSTPTNSPVSWGSVISANNIDTGLQIAGGYSNDNLYFRGWWSYGAGFGPWRTVIHSGNIGSQSVNYASSANYANSAGSAPANGGTADSVSTPSGTYKHLGAWGVGRTAAGAILVNTSYRADYADSAGYASTAGSAPANGGTADSVSTPSSGYKHLGAWGVGRTATGAILVNTSYRADIADSLSNANISQFTNNSGYITDSPTYLYPTYMYLSSLLCDSGCTYFWSMATGNVMAKAYYTTSDVSLKKNIKAITGALDDIQKLRGVEFNWKKDGKEDIGVIAQEVEKVYPELVTVNEHNGMKSVAYDRLVGPLIEAVKELAGKVENIIASIGSIKNKLTLHDKQVEELQSQIGAQQKEIEKLQQQVTKLIKK